MVRDKLLGILHYICYTMQLVVAQDKVHLEFMARKVTKEYRKLALEANLEKTVSFYKKKRNICILRNKTNRDR